MGTNYLQFEYFVPTYGSAVLQGLSVGTPMQNRRREATRDGRVQVLWVMKNQRTYRYRCEPAHMYVDHGSELGLTVNINIKSTKRERKGEGGRWDGGKKKKKKR